MVGKDGVKATTKKKKTKKKQNPNIYRLDTLITLIYLNNPNLFNRQFKGTLNFLKKIFHHKFEIRIKNLF